MPNFFSDNSDILFQLNRLDLKEIVNVLEDNYNESKNYNYAPVNFDDAMENYRKTLEIIGDIAGNYIAPRATDVDHEGAHHIDGKVQYAKGTKENLDRLAKADDGIVHTKKIRRIEFSFHDLSRCNRNCFTCRRFIDESFRTSGYCRYTLQIWNRRPERRIHSEIYNR